MAITELTEQELRTLLDDPKVLERLHQHAERRQQRNLRGAHLQSLTTNQQAALRDHMAEQVVALAADRFGPDAVDKLATADYSNMNLFDGMQKYLDDVAELAEATQKKPKVKTKASNKFELTEEEAAQKLADGIWTPQQMQQWYRENASKVARYPARRV